MKRIAFFILVALLPVLASAYDAEIDGIYYNLSGDEAEVTYRDYSYNAYSGDVVIPQSVSYNGQTYRVTSIGFYAFQNCSDLTSITFPEGLTSIDSWAFKGCTGLTTVSLPRTLTDIGNGAFDDCTNLVSVSYDPDGVPHIGQYVLDDTAWYKNQPEGLVYFGKSVYRYKGYNAPTEVVIENGTLSIASGAFHYCPEIKSLIIPNSVKYIGSSAFFQIGVSSITLPEGITEICDETFDACASLTSITIPNNVKRIGQYAFYRCI